MPTTATKKKTPRKRTTSSARKYITRDEFKKEFKEEFIQEFDSALTARFHDFYEHERREDDRNLLERIVKVEEELKNQRELMKIGFEQVNKRVELIQSNMDKRFEQVDKRFDDVNKRFDMMFKFITIGFSLVTLIIVVFKFVN